MINELDSIVLTHDIAEHGLVEGDVGVVVHVYKSGTDFEVEFVTGTGETISVSTLDSDSVRPIRADEILHIRQVVA